MAADVLVSRELKSLQDELAVSRKERATSPAEASAVPKSDEAPASEKPDQSQARDQLHEFLNEITGLFDEAEKNVSAHPAQSVVGALLVGIVIGRLLGRR